MDFHPNCPICFDHFDGLEDISACPCGHTFHYDCIVDWAQRCVEKVEAPRCPTCSAPFERVQIIETLYFDSERPRVDLQENLEMAEATIQSLKSGQAIREAEFKEKLDSLQRTLDDVRKEEASKGARVDELNEKLDSVQKEKQSEERKVGKLNEKLDSIQKEKQSEARKVGELNKKLDSVQKEKQSEERKVGELNEKLDSVLKEKQSKERKVGELNDKLREERRFSQLANETVECFRSTLDTFQHENSRLRQQNEKWRQSYDRMNWGGYGYGYDYGYDYWTSS